MGQLYVLQQTTSFFFDAGCCDAQVLKHAEVVPWPQHYMTRSLCSNLVSVGYP